MTDAQKQVADYAKSMLEKATEDCGIAMVGLHALSKGEGLTAAEVHDLQRSLYAATSAFQAYSNLVAGFPIPKKR